MAKNSFYDETLIHRCASETCIYNYKNFCKLQAIILDESATCIYKRKAGKHDRREEN